MLSSGISLPHARLCGRCQHICCYPGGTTERTFKRRSALPMFDSRNTGWLQSFKPCSETSVIRERPVLWIGTSIIREFTKSGPLNEICPSPGNGARKKIRRTWSCGILFCIYSFMLCWKVSHISLNLSNSSSLLPHFICYLFRHIVKKYPGKPIARLN